MIKAMFALCLIAMLLTGGLVHSMVEHEHGLMHGDLLHAAVSLGTVLLSFASALFFFSHIRFAFVPAPLISLLAIADPFRIALREGAIASSVYR